MINCYSNKLTRMRSMLVIILHKIVSEFNSVWATVTELLIYRLQLLIKRRLTICEQNSKTWCKSAKWFRALTRSEARAARGAVLRRNMCGFTQARVDPRGALLSNAPNCKATQFMLNNMLLVRPINATCWSAHFRVGQLHVCGFAFHKLNPHA